MFGKILKISIISIAVIIIAGGGTVAAVYYNGVRQNKAVKALGSIKISPQEAKLGQVVTATLLLKCPWHRKPLEAVAQPGEGASLLESPEISRKNIGWGYNIWQVKTELKAYRTGKIPAGKLDVTYNRYNDKTADLSKIFDIPGFKCTALQLGKKQDIMLAGKIEPAKKINRRNMYIIAALILVILIIITLFILKRYRKEKAVALPLWVVALNDLHTLRSNIKSGSVTLNNGFVTLTDIVRVYLEKRFKLPASKQTTEEFLEEINQANGPLPEIQRPFLKEFMQAAELVKFAKLPPDENTLNQALSKAEVLINETHEEDENSEGAEK